MLKTNAESGYYYYHYLLLCQNIENIVKNSFSSNSNRDYRVRASKCSHDTEGVTALNRNRNTLAKKHSRLRFVFHRCDSTADFPDEVTGLLAPGSRRLYCHWYEIDACCNVRVLLRFRRFCCCCRWSEYVTRQTYPDRSHPMPGNGHVTKEPASLRPVVYRCPCTVNGVSRRQCA